MLLTTSFSGPSATTVALFETTFAAAAGAAEGETVAGIARDLLTDTPAQDLRTFFAIEGGAPVGAAFFSRMAAREDRRSLFLLSPMAVLPPFQRRGVGQRLIRFALQNLGTEGVDIALTYGDPGYYEKLGFQPADPAILPPPFPLSQPHGWLAQSLTGRAIAPLVGSMRCVPALDDPAYW